jgi:hypothetical protein
VMLVEGNIDGVVSVLCMKDSSTEIAHDYERQTAMAKYMNVIDVNKYSAPLTSSGHTQTRMTLTDKIRSTVRDSFERPSIGDCHNDFQNLFNLVADGMVNSRIVSDWNVSPVLSPEEQYAIISERLQLNAIKAMEKLQGVKWIIRNPGSQWTSSINPIVEHPQDWYGKYYRSFRIGNVELETTMRLIRSCPGNVWSKGVMPRDVFNIILRLIIWNDSIKTADIVMEECKCTREVAEKALAANGNDMVHTIMAIQTGIVV